MKQTKGLTPFWTKLLSCVREIIHLDNVPPFFKHNPRGVLFEMVYFQQYTTNCVSSSNIRYLLILIAILITAAPLHAQQKGEEPLSQKEQQEFQQVRDEYVAAQQRLEQIQRDTIQARPELQKQEQAFNDLLIKEMKNKGHSPKQEQAEIEKLQKQLQDTKASDTEREELMNKFQEKIMAYRNAQMEAMQNQEIQKAQSELLDAIVTAMKKHDPQTEQLIERMTQSRQQLMKMPGGAASQ